MEKQIQEVSVMQKRRMQKVLDPVKHLVTLGLLGYESYLVQENTLHTRRVLNHTLMTNFPWLLGACIPMAYATKSLMFPAMFLVTSTSYSYFRVYVSDLENSPFSHSYFPGLQEI